MEKNRENNQSGQENTANPFDQKKFEGLEFDRRFSEQTTALLIYYIEKHEDNPDLYDDLEKTRKEIEKIITDNGLFQVIGSEQPSYGERAKEDAIKDVISALQGLKK